MQLSETDMEYRGVYQCSNEIITITASEMGITSVGFGDRLDGVAENRNRRTDQAALQITEYFTGKRKEFDLPLVLVGTEFQKRVWFELLDIPFGETRSYKEIAIAVGNPKACRAVGMANNKNHIPILIPCHRVIGSNGKMVGYACGVDIKQKLLDLERIL